jgi:hypothetical protein
LYQRRATTTTAARGQRHARGDWRGQIAALRQHGNPETPSEQRLTALFKVFKRIILPRRGMTP